MHPLTTWIDKGIEFYQWFSESVRSLTDRCYCTQRQLSLYIDNELTPAQHKDVDRHLEECSSCRAALAILQSTHNVLMTREPVKPPASLSERLRLAIAQEAEKQRVVTAPSRTRVVFGSRLVYAGAFAAAVLAVVTVIDMHDSHQSITSASLHSNFEVSKLGTSPAVTASLVSGVKARFNGPAKQREERLASAKTRTIMPPAESIPAGHSAQLHLAVQMTVASVAPNPQNTPEHSVRMNSRQTNIEVASALPNAVHHELSEQPAIADQAPPAVNVPPSEQPDAQTGSEMDQQPPVQASVADENGDNAPRVSLVDEEMQSMAVAVNSQNQQPKLVHLAIMQTKMANDSGGLVPIVGTNIR